MRERGGKDKGRRKGREKRVERVKEGKYVREGERWRREKKGVKESRRGEGDRGRWRKCVASLKPGGGKRSFTPLTHLVMEYTSL